MQCDPLGSQRINSFSVVSYIPGDLGDFITRLRQELVAGCVAQSHVTILPPRPLSVSVAEAEDFLRRRTRDFAPVELHLPRIGMFEQTCVIYVEVGAGAGELAEMHSELNIGPLAHSEPFRYHPHITLAQNFAPEDLDEMRSAAEARWREAPARRFLVDTLTFVQNTVENRWVDLADCALRGEAAVFVR
jgi:2'-5' RNA ligase